MGIYDRDYYREDNKPTRRDKYQRKQGIFSQLSAVVVLIVLNVILYFANSIFCQDTNTLTDLLMMKGDTLRHPLEWYRLLTYGFTHDPKSINHILFNMIALFFFGPPVEQRYGKMEFLALYLVAAFVGGLAWGIGNLGGAPAAMLGASGAVVAIVLLFCLNYPNATVFLMGIIPMPAWLLGVMFIGMDTLGMLGSPVGGQGNVAHSVHLVGAAIALVYFFGRIRFTQIFSPLARLFGRSKKGQSGYYERNNSSPNITISTPSPERRPSTPMEEEVDRILRKISTLGAESLTTGERETLQNASRHYQDRMKK